MVTRWAWLIGLAGAALIFGAVSGYWLLDTINGPATTLGTAGGLLILVYLILDRKNLSDTASTRQFRFSTTSMTMQVIVGLICVAAYVLSTRHNTTFDLTSDRAHSLSEHTLTVIKGLEEPVKILAFFPSSSGEAQHFELLSRRYEEASSSITVEWIDPLSKPLLAKKYDITSDYGTVVLEQADRQQRIEMDFTEDALTDKLVVVQSTKEHIICWAIDHGEASPDDSNSEDGFGNVVLALEALNYQVLTKRISTEGISRDCEALVVARPRTEWLGFEREAMAAYVAEGGQLLVLLDPQQVPDFASDLERFGITVGDDVVLDVDPRNMMMGVDDPSFVVLSGNSIVYHPITADLNAAIVLGVARSISIQENVEGIALQELLRTSQAAWAETDLEHEPQPDEGIELVGEVPVAAIAEVANPDVLKIVPHETVEAEGIAAEEALGRAVPIDLSPTPGGRVVVYGDADFATNQFLQLGNNKDLFLNSVAWLVREEDQIGERPETGDTLEITGLGAGVLCLVSVVLVPGTAILFAILTLARRRFL